MKKVLLGATALTAAGAFAVTAAPAQAEFDLKISGWQNNAVVFTDSEYANSVSGYNSGGRPTDNNGSGLSMYNSSEINFYATQKLDNGLTIVSRIELESSSSGTANTDETQVHINGGFGSIELGGIDTANDNMHHGTPTASLMGLSNSSYITYLGLANAGSSGRLNTSWHMGADDALGIAYYTPRIAGFQAGVSFSPNVEHNSVGAADDTDSEFYSAGVNFSTEMNGVGANVSIAGAMMNGRGNDPANVDRHTGGHTINGGANLSYMGFSVGFDMAKHTGRITGDDDGSATELEQSDDATVWQTGIKYGQGPWAISYGYINYEGRAPYDGGEEPETSMHEVAGSYNLGPGVNMGASVALSSHVGTSVEDATTQDDSDGMISTVWLGVNF